MADRRQILFAAALQRHRARAPANDDELQQLAMTVGRIVSAAGSCEV